MARIKAHLRRVSSGRKAQLLELSGLILGFYAQSVIMGSETIFLSKKEFGLLSYMAQNINCVVSVDALFQLFWGMESLDDTRTVAVHISNLRKKIEANPAHPERIVTIRGGGYMLVARNTLQVKGQFPL